MTCTYEIPVLTFGASRMVPVIETERMRLGVGETNPPSREAGKQGPSADRLSAFWTPAPTYRSPLPPNGGGRNLWFYGLPRGDLRQRIPVRQKGRFLPDRSVKDPRCPTLTTGTWKEYPAKAELRSEAKKPCTRLNHPVTRCPVLNPILVAERSEVLVKNGSKAIAGYASTLRKRYTSGRSSLHRGHRVSSKDNGVPMLKSEAMILTNELLEAAKSDNGGWNAAQLKLLGFNGFEAKWRKRAVGMEVTDQQYEDLLLLRNVHLVRGDTKPVSFCEDDAWATETRKTLLEKKNAAEAHVERLLNQSLFTFVREQPIEVSGKKWFIDFHIRRIRMAGKFPVIRVALEIDGGYHFTENQKAMDRRKDKDLLCSAMVGAVVRISADRALSMDLLSLSGAIVNPQPFTTKFYY